MLVCMDGDFSIVEKRRLKRSFPRCQLLTAEHNVNEIFRYLDKRHSNRSVSALKRISHEYFRYHVRRWKMHVIRYCFI